MGPKTGVALLVTRDNEPVIADQGIGPKAPPINVAQLVSTVAPHTSVDRPMALPVLVDGAVAVVARQTACYNLSISDGLSMRPLCPKIRHRARNKIFRILQNTEFLQFTSNPSPAPYHPPP